MKKRLLAEFAARIAEIMGEKGYRAPRSKLKFDAKKLSQIGKANSIETARKWLKGESWPRVETLHLLAQHFGVLVPWLRDGVPPKYPGNKTLDSMAEEAGIYVDQSLQRLLREWRQLPPGLQQHFLELIATMNETLRHKAA